MANKRGQAIDKTHLSIDLAEERGIIHRDYLAHCLRWSHVAKYLQKSGRYSNSTILDIGCGKELPLAKLLYSNKLIPKRYIGVDVNKLDGWDEKFNFGKMEHVMFIHGKTDVCDLDVPDQPDVITCFEVLEHVEPKHAIKIIDTIKAMLTNDGAAFVSTPCFNGKAASNHVNEMRFNALKNVFVDRGLYIENVYGTFASQREIEPAMMDNDPDFYEAYTLLKDYFCSNVLSNIFAPIYPRQSRNALWVLRKEEPDSCQPFDINDKTPWDKIRTPWSSSEHWKDLNTNV